LFGAVKQRVSRLSVTMAQLSAAEIKQYEHSPVHFAVANRDYAALRQIFASLPCLPKAGEVKTEEESILAEERADILSASIDRRDVPGRETPLHVAVKLKDATSVDMLMVAGADWSLQNEQGWSALQEAICAREDALALIITRHYQPLAWAKWCRRLPRIIAAMRRMRDFYMEVTFQFESSVIPFIGRIAPSDTYKIWKRGSNLRADMTLAGFDGFRIQRSDQSFLFLGEGSEDGKLAAGSLIMLNHKEKEITNALEGAGALPSETEVAHEVAQMSQTSLYRPGIDVTQAELMPQMTWRRQEKTETVGPWKAKIFDMLHVVVSIRSRKFPGAMSDEELFAAESDRFEADQGAYEDILTEEEKWQLENALDAAQGGTSDDESVSLGRNSSFRHESDYAPALEYKKSETAVLIDSGKEEKKGWFSWGKKSVKNDGIKRTRSLKYTINIEDGDVEGSSGSVPDDSNSLMNKFPNQSSTSSDKSVEHRTAGFQTDASMFMKKGKEKASKKGKKEEDKTKKPSTSSDSQHEGEYKKGVKPVLWLTPDFPLKTEELLPLLDILANKVKAVRRLRDLFTTKLPPGTFPVKVAIPVVPTIRVVITFSKFEELQSSEEFATPVSSPEFFQDAKGKDVDAPKSSSSWISWLRGSQSEPVNEAMCLEDYLEGDLEPFHIPSDYTWVGMNEKKRRMKMKKSKHRKDKKPDSASRDRSDDKD